MNSMLPLFLFVPFALSFAQHDSAAWYHPLHVGNEWLYKESYSQTQFPGPPLVTVSVILNSVNRDTVIDNAVWSVMQSKNFNTNTVTQWLESYDTASSRFVSNGAMIDSAHCRQPNVLFGFPEKMFVQKIIPDTVLSVSTASRHLAMSVTGAVRTWKFSHGFGMVWKDESDGDIFFGSGRTKTLVYAKINGIPYGTKNILMADSLSRYHPLHTGNTWIYSVSGWNGADTTINVYMTHTVAGDTMIAFTRYKKIVRLMSNSAEITVRAEQFDDVTGQYLRYNSSHWQLEDSTAANVAGQHFGGRMLSALEPGAMFSVPTLFRTITATDVVDQQRIATYAYGFGLVEEIIVQDPAPEPMFRAQLVYAKINGTEYGTAPLSVGLPGQTIPASFSLSQNYPNPFNPSTTILYSLPRDGIVTLTVYDALGREVSTLVNEFKTAGIYTATFSAKGARLPSVGPGSASGGNGSILSSGLYFYQLRSGTYAETRKMLLIQ